ncbi:MAG: EF2563 family selenium-dependent molybdenum hydroxylase system protein [Lachnospiraceae bacterium]|nr:EF2563 family selenium-dependent molybdenum hydroxylase system protein [Lachnospiraceae bacterium]
MLVLIRGAGDIASGIAVRLKRSGFDVIMTEIKEPLAIRRTVAFCEAVRLKGETVKVEGFEAKLAKDESEALKLMCTGVIPVLVDPELKCLDEIKPEILVDAILAKKNLGTKKSFADIVIGIGPGFTAGEDCHAVIESMRCHTLGRAYYEGTTIPNTAVPGLIGGFAGERVMRAPCDGVFESTLSIGDVVKAGDTVGYVDGQPMKASIDGIIRGLIADGTPVTSGLKSGDVDPRADATYCTLVSDKALAIGGGVLEAIMHFGGQ